MAIRRGVRLVLTLIGLAVVVSMTGVLVLYLALARGPAVPASAVLVVAPRGEIVEMAPDVLLGPVLGRDTYTLRGLVETLRKASRDARITGVILMPSGLDLPYWAKVQELRDAVVEFRRSGKPVVAFLEYGGDREYYLASAADRVFLLPTSPLDLTGIASYQVFLRGALDLVGAYPDFLHVGDYKSAPEQLTETGFTPAHREMTESLNRDAFDQLVRGIAEARGKTEDQVRRLLDQGPFAPAEAVAAGLVDELVYADELDSRLEALRGGGRPAERIDAAAYRRVSLRSLGLRTRGKIAVIYAVGTIVSGRSGFDPLSGALVGSDTLVQQIRRVRDDPTVDAIVLRIDSPGGSSTASDVIWRELKVARQARPERPLIASMSDLAASGGYYLAMATDAIVAQPGTLTGSIGVYGGKIVIGGALEKAGVSGETVKSGVNADIYSPFSRFTPAQRDKLQRYMDGFYATFVERVAEARDTTAERIQEVAQGRVWTGRQAHERGLVDALGGLEAAIAMAKERAGLPAEEEVEIVAYPPRRSLYDVLTSDWGDGTMSRLIGLFGTSADVRALAAVAAPARLFRRGEPLALMPVAFVR